MARTFVFEGTDLVGKSTTAKILAEQNSFRLERNVAMRDSYQLLSSVINDIERARLRHVCVGATTVFDRWQLISDIIYCNYIFKTASRVLPYIKEFVQQCNSAGMVFIVFRCQDEEELTARFTNRGDDERTLEEIKTLQQAYTDFFTTGYGADLHSVFIDTSNKTPDQVVAEVKNMIKILGGC